MYNNKGFTLMEIIIVVALIGILTAISIPVIKPMIASQRISSAAQSVRSALQRAKTEAIKNQTTATVTFIAGTGSAASYSTSLAEGTIIGTTSGTLSSTVQMYNVAFGTPPANTVQFNSLGLATGFAGEVRFTDADNTIFKSVNITNSGNITILKSTTDGSFVE